MLSSAEDRKLELEIKPACIKYCCVLFLSTLLYTLRLQNSYNLPLTFWHVLHHVWSHPRTFPHLDNLVSTNAVAQQDRRVLPSKFYLPRCATPKYEKPRFCFSQKSQQLRQVLPDAKKYVADLSNESRVLVLSTDRGTVVLCALKRREFSLAFPVLLSGNLQMELSK